MHSYVLIYLFLWPHFVNHGIQISTPHNTNKVSDGPLMLKLVLALLPRTHCFTMICAHFQSFNNCSCISEPSDPTLPMASSETCGVLDCSYMIGFLVLFFFAVLLLFVCATFHISTTVR